MPVYESIKSCQDRGHAGCSSRGQMKTITFMGGNRRPLWILSQPVEVSEIILRETQFAIWRRSSSLRFTRSTTKDFLG